MWISSHDRPFAYIPFAGSPKRRISARIVPSCRAKTLTLDRTKVFTLAGQFFEMLAQACRGRPTQNKGRYNLELIELVKIIQEHQTEKMSSGEIREALAAAGVSVREGESWRIWLWRERKDRLIAGDSAAPTARSKKSQ